MKTLNKYILKEFIENFVIYFGIISLLFLLNSLYQMIKPLLSARTSLLTLAKLLIFLFPSVVSISLPITILLSILLTFSSMREFGEITVMYTLGLNRKSFTKTILLLSFLVSLVFIYFNGYVVPQSQKNFKYTYRNMLLSSPIVKFSNNTFLSLGNKKIFVKKVKDNLLENIYIYSPVDDSTIQTISAKIAKLEVNLQDDIILNLFDGRLSVINRKDIYKVTQMFFDRYVFVIYSAQLKNIFDNITSFRELTNNELLRYYKNITSTSYSVSEILSELFLRYTLSFSIFCFVLIGSFVGTKIKHNSKSLSFVITIIIIGIYYFVLSLSITILQHLPKNKIFFYSIFVMQLPNILLLMVYFFMKQYDKN